jgi:hypothetical protein
MIIENILKNQTTLRRLYGKYFDCNSFVIIDESTIKKKNIMKDINLCAMLYNGRHYKLTYIVNVDQSFNIKNIFICTDYMFILLDDTNNIKKIYDTYFNARYYDKSNDYVTYDVFQCICKIIIEKKGILVFSNDRNMMTIKMYVLIMQNNANQ